MNDDEYYEFCMANPNTRFERTAEGEIVIVPPAGGESSYQSGESQGELRQWAKRDGRGKAFESSVEFILPTRAAFSPDAAWVSNARLARLSKEQRRKFLPICPEFVIEIMSPSDRLRDAKEKMKEWMRGGVELGWLIQPDRETIYIYRAGQTEPEKRTGITKLAGEGPVNGFELDLTDIWAGL
jgi:Uma2 family endonuclease